MESTSEPIETLIDGPSDGYRAPRSFVSPAPEVAVPRAPHAAPTLRRPSRLSEERRRALAHAWSQVRFAFIVFMATRLVLLLVALIDGRLRHVPFINTLTNWDGFWYRTIAGSGYPQVIPHYQSDLGFFPLYPMVSRVFSYLFHWTTQYGTPGALTVAGVLVSTAGGFVSVVLIQRLATEWWDAQAGRRAVLLFCLFPGSIVFTMVYAEGIAIPLAIGCIYALSRRRWVLAGVLAGLATAAEPEALILCVVCAVSALLEWRRQGWQLRPALRSFSAPTLSPLGALGFGIFLWAWTGSPFASFNVQHKYWHESTTPLALVHDATTLASEVNWHHLGRSQINLNYVVGLVGAVLLAVMLVLLYRQRRRVSVEAIVWTLGITFLMVTSSNVPPNPRLLITAFPLLMVVAYYVRGKWFRVLLGVNAILFVGLSALTFVGLTLRP